MTTHEAYLGINDRLNSFIFVIADNVQYRV